MLEWYDRYFVSWKQIEEAVCMENSSFVIITGLSDAISKDLQKRGMWRKYEKLLRTIRSRYENHIITSKRSEIVRRILIWWLEHCSIGRRNGFPRGLLALVVVQNCRGLVLTWRFNFKYFTKNPRCNDWDERNDNICYQHKIRKTCNCKSIATT